MIWMRRILATVVLLLCVAGIVACVTAIVGVWVVRQQAEAKVDEALPRLDDGLTRISSGLQAADQSLVEASADLDQFRRAAADLSGDLERDRQTTALLQTLIAQRLGPKAENLEERLALVTDVVPTLNALLANVGQLEAVSGGVIDQARLDDAIRRTNQLTTSLRRLQQLVGKGNPLSPQTLTEQADEIAITLREARAALTAWRAEVNRVREKTPELAVRVKRWLLLSARGVTVMGSWFILAQLSLFVHACHWFRGRRPAGAPALD